MLAAAVGLAGVLYVLFSAASNQSAPSGLDRFADGTLSKLEVIPDPPEQPLVAFTDVEGAKVTLGDFRGQVVLVNIWATWCPPCVKEMPTLAELHRAYADQGFKVVAVSVDSVAERQIAQKQLAELSGGALAFFHDPNYGIVYPMKARGFPTSVLYDAYGREVARLAGEADWSSPQARGLIEAVLAEQPSRPSPSTPAAAATAPARAM